MFKKMYKDLMSLALVVLALVLITFFALYNAQMPEQERFSVAPKEKQEAKEAALLELEKDFYANIYLEGKGNDKSKNFITVLSDYACPWSNKFYNETIKPFLSQKQLNDIFVQYDFLSLGEQSPTLIASEAAYCANDQGKFWEMHDKMFGLSSSGQDIETAFSKENIYKIAKEIDLTEDSFKECIENKKYRSLIIKRASHYLEVFDKLGVPSTFVNGKPITLFIDGSEQMVGAIDLKTFTDKINEMKYR